MTSPTSETHVYEISGFECVDLSREQIIDLWHIEKDKQYKLFLTATYDVNSNTIIDSLEKWLEINNDPSDYFLYSEYVRAAIWRSLMQEGRKINTSVPVGVVAERDVVVLAQLELVETFIFYLDHIQDQNEQMKLLMVFLGIYLEVLLKKYEVIDLEANPALQQVEQRKRFDDIDEGQLCDIIQIYGTKYGPNNLLARIHTYNTAHEVIRRFNQFFKVDIKEILASHSLTTNAKTAFEELGG